MGLEMAPYTSRRKECCVEVGNNWCRRVILVTLRPTDEVAQSLTCGIDIADIQGGFDAVAIMAKSLHVFHRPEFPMFRVISVNHTQGDSVICFKFLWLP
ncbi:hypothetical protein LCGC14_1320320 [marine sediment metagenome]|uniref:Uncharacterized protein n=1 Tax=marine sediment metagenome TaxID=412755 RepID=A0A0F9L516_9ZZZZ